MLLGVPRMKIHAKLCIIKKRIGSKISQYGFVSTGNLHEKTATVYGDHCLLTSQRNIMADINRIFDYLANWKNGQQPLRNCKTLLVCPNNMRRSLEELIRFEIKQAKAGKASGIILKVNSLSDATLIDLLMQAAKSGVPVQMIVRGIFCAKPELVLDKKASCKAISIVDEYLEHAR